MLEILNNLNHQQREAVLHFDGPCMVLAGAGSGKTRVLTRRIISLINNHVPPNAILAITFTNKAAQEMRNRVAEMFPGYTGQWIQTFHAACYRILKMDIEHIGYQSNFTIVDEGESKSLVKEILKEENDFETKPEEVLGIIKKIKNSLLEPQEYLDSLKLSYQLREKYHRVYHIYNSRLKDLNSLDYEDLITLCIKLFRDYPQVLEKYQNWFKYIMIDEYQDTNYSQYLWANLLAAKHHNIFIVGDPDQSIYSWRGAEPINIKRFLNDYPDSKTIKLEKNYRSTKNILAAANAVIRNNEDREEKELFTDNEAGDRLICFCAGDSYQEARFVADTISDLVDREGRKYSDCAIFYRTHAQSRILEDALINKFIPYRIIGARKFYERKEIKDIIAYLKLACNSNDRLSFQRIINTPRRGIGEKTIEKIENYALEKDLPVLDILAEPMSIPGISGKMENALQEFHGMIKLLGTLAESGTSIREILEEAINLSGYIEYIKKNYMADATERVENLQELKSMAMEFEKEGGQGLEDFLAGIALVQDTDDLDYTDTILLMTYHGAKGLEFPIVFMTGMEEGVFPSYRTETVQDLEEERRLCYVGITRARERLYLTNAVSRLLYGFERNNPPSRFIKEIPENLVTSPSAPKMVHEKLEEGDTVIHRKFGVGNITSLTDDGIAVIDFERAGIRMLRLDIAPLDKIG